jgi:hypothetical protein
MRDAISLQNDEVAFEGVGGRLGQLGGAVLGVDRLAVSDLNILETRRVR